MINNPKQPQLKIIPLGGSSMVNKNMFVYECGKDIVIVDCGIGFPESEQLGVDVVIPDINYLKNKLDKIRGIVITHGHEDHFGALPYLLKDLGNPPIFASKLVRGLIQVKLEEFNLLKGAQINQIDPEDNSFSLGQFEFTPFRVNHSVPDSLGFFIRTPLGNLVHVSDFKFDWTPVDGKFFDVAKLVKLTSQAPVRCLLSDCLGATSRGYTKSERFIQHSFEHELDRAPGQIFISTVSSNISRIQQAINAALKYGRKVAFLGLSIERNAEVAQNLGYLKIPPGTIVNSRTVHKYADNQLLIIIAGSYGQENSALSRLAEGSHRLISLKPGAVVVFSADPIPGVYDQVGRVIDKLTEKGARVVYSEIQENLHVSGHGSQGDLSLLAALVRPNHFVPIGGNPRHMRAYTNLIAKMNFDKNKILELSSGDGIVITPNQIKVKKLISLSNIFVDGSQVGDVGAVVLRDRQILSEEGIFVIIVKKDKNGKFKKSVNIVSRGFVYMAISEQLIKKAEKLVQEVIEDKKTSSWNSVRTRIEKRIADFLYRKTQRNPMVVVVLVD
ncbi:hypothetical protein B5M47_02295 [candidate division CPR3 bacterium 4484_211]|uniref:Ribonuclease J n=1 Tax=candidate division CPR3 bacterium 4484_211 TaxID=1968527 RepID=A0A1W9NY67_UNCC3|nr:MAG: hypothetical protein B5M47_02295 [candidate division CPR3 bacterium 4484_211]